MYWIQNPWGREDTPPIGPTRSHRAQEREHRARQRLWILYVDDRQSSSLPMSPDIENSLIGVFTSEDKLVDAAMRFVNTSLEEIGMYSNFEELGVRLIHKNQIVHSEEDSQFFRFDEDFSLIPVE